MTAIILQVFGENLLLWIFIEEQIRSQANRMIIIKSRKRKIRTIKLTVPDEFWYEEFYVDKPDVGKRNKEATVTGKYLGNSEKLKKILGENPKVTIKAVTSNLAGQNKGDNGQWDITFPSKFEIYAPNGTPWIYRLAEQVEEPYKVKRNSRKRFLL